MVSTPTFSQKSDTAERTTDRATHWRCAVPVLLCAIYVAECTWFIRTQSLTFDEPVHITAGQEAWREGRFARWNDHPPLQRLLCSLPLLSSKYQITVEGQPDAYRVTAVQPDPQSVAWRGRAVSVVLGVILALLLWFAALRSYSGGAANFVLALFVLSPAIVAHFSLITTDGAGTLMIFAAAVQLVRWRHDSSCKQIILLGAVLGFLLLAKFYTPPMFLIAIAWILVLKHDGYAINPRKWNWGHAATAMVIAFLVLWAGYFFHVSRLSIHNGELVATFPHRDEPIVKQVHSALNFSIPVPAGEYLEGLRTVAFHNHRGHRSYFLGEVSEKGGWKAYYPTVILLKWPTIVLVILLAAAVAAGSRRLRLPHDWVVMASFPAGFLCFAIFSKIDIGDRHILPLYPFVLLFCGTVWQFTAARRWLAPILVTGLMLHAADGVRYAPDYLAYFNLFVGQDQGYKLVSDSNVDWGQGLIALKTYQDKHPDKIIHLAYWGSMDPSLYGVRAVPLLPGKPVSGTVVVSPTALTGQYLGDPNGYSWLLKQRPEGTLDHVLLRFEVGRLPVNPLQSPP